jgi:hypothetical protein
MPFRFDAWENEPDDVLLGILSTETLVESRPIAVVSCGRLITRERTLNQMAIMEDCFYEYVYRQLGL